MGMFLSKYSMLHALGYGDDSYILPETNKILSKYKLFGLIIHDPETQKEFHNKLTEIFERLDYITGEDFLFFCLTDPPKSFKEKPNRDYFGIWEKDELLSPKNAYRTKDESVTAYTLCQALGLEYEDMPIIIFTNNFQFDRFRYIKTSSASIENQLREIGFFCSQKHNYFNLINDPELLHLIKKIDTCGGNDLVNNQEPIAKTLADFLSFIVKDPIQRDNTILKHVNTILSDNLLENNDLPMALSKMKDDKWWKPKKREEQGLQKTEEYEAESIENRRKEKKNLYLLGGISNLVNAKSIINENNILYSECKPEFDQKPEKSTGNCFDSITRINLIEDENLSIHNDLLEDESKIVLRTFNTVFPNFKRLIQDQDLPLDFSPLISSLCKIFEIEINLSIVHWIRASLNIEMPTYFRKVKPGDGTFSMLPSSKLISNPKPIDFNCGRLDKWKAPGMGESELICKTLHLENQFPDNLITDYDNFIHCWAVIRNHRNMAAHTEAMTQRQFLETKNAFTNFNDSGYFDQLTNIKLHLKSQ